MEGEGSKEDSTPSQSKGSSETLTEHFEQLRMTEEKRLKEDQATGNEIPIFSTEHKNSPEYTYPLEDKDPDEDINKAVDEGFIDEEELKKLEANMTDEEKKEHKSESQRLKELGNKCFKEEEYEQAIKHYNEALLICPLCFSKDRAILYANRAAARAKLNFKEEAVLDCNKAIELDERYIKALSRRAGLYRSLEKLDEALADWQKVLELDPSNIEARQACMTLPDEIAARNERLKTEMLGKLKDLGNVFLKPFGLSTNNFQMVQDPNTGGYSINFNNNPPPPPASSS